MARITAFAVILLGLAACQGNNMNTTADVEQGAAMGEELGEPSDGLNNETEVE